ncbi:hypothetical protein DPEC_G00207440 [Dallia pectoralis]|uniref:Uncharacterized protein n=1 Tax=Dallia pectoralis TaxID=75939 RepID=A0ACC2G576_DALPE|nr:hypothetical protein DPEC_G00207440 [Dallia pectoralis]
MTARGLTPAAGLDARLHWARSSSGGGGRTSVPKTSINSWEKKTVGRGPSSYSELSSKELIRCLWSVTVEFKLFSVAVNASKDDLKSADSAFLCSSNRALSSANVTLADESSLSCLPFILDIAET